MNLDEELAKCETMEDLTGKNGLIQKLVGGMVEKLLEKEMEDHLGYEKHSCTLQTHSWSCITSNAYNFSRMIQYLIEHPLSSSVFFIDIAHCLGEYRTGSLSMFIP
ncbi:MAG: hypothetical protein QNJ27_05200 [Simkaniaceae bacterium]|nr:hypothetical protein [Simkaniaceae bacterium]